MNIQILITANPRVLLNPKTAPPAPMKSISNVNNQDNVFIQFCDVMDFPIAKIMKMKKIVQYKNIRSMQDRRPLLIARIFLTTQLLQESVMAIGKCPP